MNENKKVKEFLDNLKIKYRIIDVSKEFSCLTDALRFLNIKYRYGLKILAYKIERGIILLLTREDRSVDEKRLKQILNVNFIEEASNNELLKLGFPNGKLNFFSLKSKFEIYVDSVVFDVGKIVTNLDSNRFLIEIEREELERFLKDLGFREIEVSFPNPLLQDSDNINIKTVLSGITPSGKALHIGNYYGAVKPQMELQKVVDRSYYFVADLHALTTVQKKEELEECIINNILDFIALGLDPNKSAYFRQSDVPAHCQLAIVLANYIPFSFLKRMHAFKDKLEKGATYDQINMGLFNYPILMAADILLYKPDGVPVGEDQRQHVELSRDIAERFNDTYGKDFFPLPEPLIQSGFSAKVIGTDGKRKMSKSLGNVIGIFEEEEIIKQQIMSCYTDPNRIRATDPGNVEGNPIFIYHDLINDDKDEVCDLKRRYEEGKVGDVEVKEKLFKAHMRTFSSAREKRRKIAGNKDLAKDILCEGAKKAREVAEKSIDEVYEIIGIENEMSCRKMY